MLWFDDDQLGDHVGAGVYMKSSKFTHTYYTLTLTETHAHIYTYRVHMDTSKALPCTSMHTHTCTYVPFQHPTVGSGAGKNV